MVKKVLIISVLLALIFIGTGCENYHKEFYPDGSLKIEMETNGEGVYNGSYKDGRKVSFVL
jgi:hypothetical protein